MKTKKKRLGDVGIRLKPDEPNLLEIYTKLRRRTRRKKRQKKIKKNHSLGTSAAANIFGIFSVFFN